MTVITKPFKVFLVLLACCLVSCNSSIYDATTVIENSDWAYSNPISFEFDIQDTTKIYNVFLDVEHRLDYAFENVYCVVECYAGKDLVQQQQVSMDLADKKGNWKGDCGKEVCVGKIPLIPNTTFPIKGLYKIIVKQYTRHETLVGINSLRLIVTEAEAVS